ncbi:MAG TPA: hypothetical protein VGM63_10955 [Mucilaginibacter sp.]
MNIKLLIAAIFFSLIFAGCHLFDDAHHALSYFCPKLNISLNGVHESWNKSSTLAIKSYVLQYSSDDEKAVESYFLNNNNGYAPVKDSALLSLNSDEHTFIEDNDTTVGKKFKSAGDSAIVVFNQSRQEIIIVEYLGNHRKTKESK